MMDECGKVNGSNNMAKTEVGKREKNDDIVEKVELIKERGKEN